MYADGYNLTINNVVDVACKKIPVYVNEKVLEKVDVSREILLKSIENDEPIYGVTTGFGEMVSIHVDKIKEEDLQHNLIRSHSAGVGKIFSKEQVRAAMVIRLNAFARGYSAVRREIINQLVVYLNTNIIPIVPQIGSLGASGDLAPLSHIALALIGEGYVLCL